ncbi:AraC family transcriptional regulator [Myroides sp. M-43]|uniref:helix-turn-helix domain-containing protein n=1 Tax=Myroides oncorhynchi TaxID=2893756 RepID=UPI001E477DBE|nr:AraC family transcriptional regulator [Myroides oncorhynchi]MCC9044043.1 AraC family transcriptional regulator [Myroides oncorhynchi]
MKSLLILFLTVFTVGNQTVNWQKTNTYLMDEGNSYIQWVKGQFFQIKDTEYDLNISLNLLTMSDEDFTLIEGDNVSDSSLSQSLVNRWNAFLLLSIVSFGIAIKYFKRREYILANNAITKLERDSKENCCIVNDNSLDLDSERRYITLEREIAILKQVDSFEKGRDFLDKNISLNLLSARFGVNHRYLSYVVNKHKECDFATYVNELRVMYIVSCLENKPQYLKYKISYLAEQSGFASHSRFTVTFKKVTGYPPSVFINNLRKSKVK